jgi:hypothetical protein
MGYLPQHGPGVSYIGCIQDPLYIKKKKYIHKNSVYRIHKHTLFRKQGVSPVSSDAPTASSSEPTTATLSARSSIRVNATTAVHPENMPLVSASWVSVIWKDLWRRSGTGCEGFSMRTWRRVYAMNFNINDYMEIGGAEGTFLVT